MEANRGGQSTNWKETQLMGPTQDDPTGREWTWEEDGYTVIRSNARSGPGRHDNCGILMYVKDGVLEKIEGDPENPYNQDVSARVALRSRKCCTTRIA